MGMGNEGLRRVEGVKYLFRILGECVDLDW